MSVGLPVEEKSAANAHVHPTFQRILNDFVEPVALPRFMVQVWDNGGWSDYWPVNAANRKAARVEACKALSPFWLARRWRVGPQLGVGL